MLRRFALKRRKTLSNLHLPTTDKYAWKLRSDCLTLGSDVAVFAKNKRQKLFASLYSELSSAPLLSQLPEPWGFKDIEKAAHRVVDAITKDQKIFIFGDYDVDGTTSCALLSEFFAQIGVNVEIYIPDRLTEGYGLNVVGLEKCVHLGAQLIITVDNGISAVSACARAKEIGIDVIITDHHDCPDILPDAFAIINPKQKDCHFGFPMLAGVGVAFYLAIAVRSLLKKMKPDVQVNLKSFLDLVAIGTIADMAALISVNHILCKIGLEVLHKNILSGMRVGLNQLLKLSGWDGDRPITASDIGFKIGPRLNAAGRLGNALNSVKVLLTKNSDEAFECAKFLHDENTQRQMLEKEYTKEALDCAQDLLSPETKAFVLHKEHWHVGVVGLVASRVLEKFYKPVLVFGTLDGKLKGSGRSTHAFNLFEVLNQVRSEFISFGGHFHAVGLTLDPSKFNWLQNYLNECAHKLIHPNDSIPILNIDGHIELSQIKLNFVENFTQFEPFGIGNPNLNWLVGPVSVKHVKRIGKDPGADHARVQLSQGKNTLFATAFGAATKFEQWQETGTDLYVVLSLKTKFWNQDVLLDVCVIDVAPVLYLSQSDTHDLFQTGQQGYDSTTARSGTIADSSLV